MTNPSVFSTKIKTRLKPLNQKKINNHPILISPQDGVIHDLVSFLYDSIFSFIFFFKNFLKVYILQVKTSFIYSLVSNNQQIHFFANYNPLVTYCIRIKDWAHAKGDNQIVTRFYHILFKFQYHKNLSEFVFQFQLVYASAFSLCYDVHI